MAYKKFFWQFAISTLALAVISFSAFKTARGNSNRESCRLNLKQLSLCLQLYVDDYDGRFPVQNGACNSLPNENNSLTTSCGWTQSLKFYTKSSAIYNCPSNPNGNRWPIQVTSYWLNGRLAGAPTKRVVKPAQTFFLGEGGEPDVAGPDYVRSSLLPWIGDGNTPIYRHRGGANYLFADGHIAFLTPPQAEHFGGRPDPFLVR